MSALPSPTLATLPSAFAQAVLNGLAARPKRLCGPPLEPAATLPPECGRDETLLLERCAAQLAAAAGPGATVIELGDGSARRMPRLLAALERPAACRQAADVDALAALPLAAGDRRRLLYAPGATIAHGAPAAVQAMLERIGRIAGPEALLLIGADATRDPAVALRAAAGATPTALARNLLLRINRELHATFAPDAFRHAARFDAAERRIDTQLVAEYTQRVAVGGGTLHFAIGEPIHTGSRWLWSPIRFQSLAGRAGWAPLRLWMHDGAPHAALMLLQRKRAICMR